MLGTRTISQNLSRFAVSGSSSSTRAAGQRLLIRHAEGRRSFVSKPQPPAAEKTAQKPLGEAGAPAPLKKGGGFGLGSLVMVAGVATAGSLAAYQYSPEFREAADRCPVPMVASTLKQASDSIEGILKDAKAMVGLDKASPVEKQKAIIPKEKKEAPAAPVVQKEVKAPAKPVVKVEKKVAEDKKVVKKEPEIAPAVVHEVPKKQEPAPVPVPEKKKSELDLIEEKGKEMRLDTMERSVEAVMTESSALRKDLEGTLLQDLDRLDREGLRYRIIQLAAELQERTKWEALRLHESLKQAQDESSRRYNDLLRQQRDMFEETLAKEIRQTETRVVDAAAEDMKNKLADIQKAQENEYRKFTSEESDRLSGEFLAQYNSEVEKLRAEYIEKTENRIQALQRLQDEVSAVENVLNETSSYYTAASQINKLSAVALALAKKLETSDPIASELSLLKQASMGDELMTIVANSLKVEGKKGVPTVEQLKVRFESVRKAARKAAMIPEATEGVFGQLLGSLIAFITIQPVGNIQGEGADEVLARTAYLLELGDLKTAVLEMTTLTGKESLIVRDWIQDAKLRLQAEQAVKIFNAHASLLNEKQV
mmetsp:Transcript_18944/g.23862  ORF Transcript_18944/g.23862 Transcript_18944/m.23862 type:complete len:596 (+) Transcript_18944:91-1878(+)